MTPPNVSAYYHPQTNQLNFPAGIPQPPSRFNSKLTLGEDRADLAARSWHISPGIMPRLLKNCALSKALPGQRFFAGVAQWACGDARVEQKRLDAAVNPRSPEAFRVAGVVSNMPQFARAFGCKEVSP